MTLQQRWLLPVLFVLVNLAGCAGVFEQAATAALNAERERAGLERKEIDLPDGLRYAYLEGGQGEPLMLLHGFGGNKDNFVRTARTLTTHYRVIIPDHIGFGESAHPQQADYAPPAQVERLRALARALGIARLHLGGNSMGGQIALAYAATYPDEVASLWLLDPAGVWSGPKSELANTILSGGRNRLIVRNEDEFAELFHFAMSDPPFVPRLFLKALAKERIRNADLEERIFQQIATASVEQQIKGLRTPALIVWGAEDRIINAGTAEVLHQLLPRSTVIVMPGTGHMPMLEKPRQSADDYLRFRAALQPESQ
ncbi:MAG TPA: alpha/beta hydrolase [Noviherbaspirillum sp.]|uniref:alpha/beta fold hydrolase n=1 Tax=Noviherbaspirillum sp. TaxID=1926288 RepID=UPI002B481133|nr:alpha/beta hydrolase [Noviherbaspirillum sp.]HJV87663.1 alpha/beta hydrolase [Noviherbaspirillum sp.]